MTHAEKYVRNLRILEERNAGRKMSELAEMFDLAEKYVGQICKQMGARKFRCPAVNPKINPLHGSDHQNWHDDPDVAKIIAERIPTFEYAGNYTGSDGYADIRCKTCGEIIKRSWVSIRHGTATCPTCEHARALERQAQKKAEAKAATAERERIRKEQAEIIRLAKIKPVLRIVCVECGQTFETTDGKRVCCSPECSKHRQNRKADRRLKRYGQKENGITLTRLYNRDKGICYLCGRTCDWNDKTTNENGTIICGDNYPSIEHVIPLSLGGPNEWDNVRLACRGCNNAKRAHSDVKICANGQLALNF